MAETPEGIKYEWKKGGDMSVRTEGVHTNFFGTGNIYLQSHAGHQVLLGNQMQWVRVNYPDGFSLSYRNGSAMMKLADQTSAVFTPKYKVMDTHTGHMIVLDKDNTLEAYGPYGAKAVLSDTSSQLYSEHEDAHANFTVGGKYDVLCKEDMLYKACRLDI